MAEYIERAAAVKSLLRMRRPENSVAQNRMLSIIQMDMLKLPAADVAPVVRCKDCMHCGFCGDATNLQVMGFYGFCSRGERKERKDGGDSDAAG